jgi:hypothetical protein
MPFVPRALHSNANTILASRQARSRLTVCYHYRSAAFIMIRREQEVYDAIFSVLYQLPYYADR